MTTALLILTFACMALALGISLAIALDDMGFIRMRSVWRNQYDWFYSRLVIAFHIFGVLAIFSMMV